MTFSPPLLATPANFNGRVPPLRLFRRCLFSSGERQLSALDKYTYIHSLPIHRRSFIALRVPSFSSRFLRQMRPALVSRISLYFTTIIIAARETIRNNKANQTKRDRQRIVAKESLQRDDKFLAYVVVKGKVISKRDSSFEFFFFFKD